jgi:methionyl-tRNA formyltransferase
MPDAAYLVAGRTPWNRTVFEEDMAGLPGRWEFIATPQELTRERLDALEPRFIFFMHWSWKVPADILEAFECVCFHMSDVPFGRGGSPMQNLIQRGIRSTVLTALRMVDEMDAGPVYCKEPLSLEGGGEEILIRQSRLAARMARRLIDEQPAPEPQTGTPVVFARRKPADSEVTALGSLGALHDFLRMLDADGYPHAFLVHAGFRFEFKRPGLYDGRILADVTITRVEGKR